MDKTRRLILGYQVINKKIITDTFNRANGTLSGWDFTNNAWTIISNAAVCTPTLGTELFSNIDFASDTVWTKGTAWTIGSGVASHASGTASNMTQATGTIENWYKLVFDIITASGSTTAFFGASTAATIGAAHTTTGTKTNTNRQATATTQGIRSSANTGTFDNASVKLITLSDMFATKLAWINATIRANLSINNGTPAGLVGWLDSYTNPANFIIAYHTGDRIKLEKCVAGVYTNLVTSIVTYAANAEIKLKGVRSGANLLLDVYYNGSQVGTQQTVSDAGITANRRSGMFNTSELNSINNISIR